MIGLCEIFRAINVNIHYGRERFPEGLCARGICRCIRAGFIRPASCYLPGLNMIHLLNKKTPFLIENGVQFLI